MQENTPRMAGTMTITPTFHAGSLLRFASMIVTRNRISTKRANPDIIEVMLVFLISRWRLQNGNVTARRLLRSRVSYPICN